MQPLLWMDVMLSFICMGFPKVCGTESKRKIQNENNSFHRESNQPPLAFQPSALDPLVTWKDNGLCFLKLLHFLNWHLIIPTRMKYNACFKEERTVK